MTKEAVKVVLDALSHKPFSTLVESGYKKIALANVLAVKSNQIEKAGGLSDSDNETLDRAIEKKNLEGVKEAIERYLTEHYQ